MNFSRFVVELKRRNVYRAAIAYAMTAWLLAQVATQIFPFFDIPNAAVRWIIIALVIGFPIAMLLAWLYEFTSEGIVRSDALNPAEVPSARRATGRILDFIIIGVLAAIIGVLVIERYAFSRLAPEPTASKTIAVLPFTNLSKDEENAFFAAGVQDEILAQLARIADLKVISRTSVNAYRSDLPRNLRQIAHELGVAHVVEGTVQRFENRVRISTQLIEARSDSHLWAEHYDRPLGDIFAIQTEVAEKIAAQLQVRLTSAEKTAIEQRPTQNFEAYDLYLRAKELLSQTTAGMMEDDPLRNQKAAELLEQAVARDPSFSLAWSALAKACFALYWTGGADPILRGVRPDQPTEWRDRGEAALSKAIQIAPDAGETHLARALDFYWGHLDYDHALEELEIASRALPNDAEVFRTTSWVERRLGRWKECLRHGVKAVELDPRNRGERANLIHDYRMVRRYHEGLRAAEQAVADFPENDNFQLAHAELLIDSGDLGGARAALEALPSTRPLDFTAFAAWLNLLLYERKLDEAERFVSELAGLVHNELFLPEVCFEGFIAQAQNDRAKIIASFTSCRDQLETKVRAHPVIHWRSMLALAYAALGHEQEALREEALALAVPDWVNRQFIVLDLPTIYCWLGKREQALDALEKVVKSEIAVSYGDLKFNPIWDSLRDDPRFEKILAEAAKPLL